MFYRKCTMIRDLNFIERMTSSVLQRARIGAYFVLLTGFLLT